METVETLKKEYNLLVDHEMETDMVFMEIRRTVNSIPRTHDFPLNEDVCNNTLAKLNKIKDSYQEIATHFEDNSIEDIPENFKNKLFDRLMGISDKIDLVSKFSETVGSKTDLESKAVINEDSDSKDIVNFEPAPIPVKKQKQKLQQVKPVEATINAESKVEDKEPIKQETPVVKRAEVITDPTREELLTEAKIEFPEEVDEPKKVIAPNNKQEEKPPVKKVVEEVHAEPTFDKVVTKSEKKSKEVEDDDETLEFEVESSDNIIVSKDPATISDEDLDNSESIETEERDEPLVNEDEDIDNPGLLSDDDLNNIEIVDKEDLKKAKIEAEADESESTIDEDKTLYDTSKTISRKRVNPTLKTLSKLDTSKLDLKNVSIFDYDGNDEEFRKEYVTSRNNMMAAPRISRVALLMSGHYEEISAYGNWDLGTIGRTLSDSSVDFVDREIALYNSIYAHVMYVSYAKTKPDFDEWCKHIKYPDLNSLFFGVYDANSVGVNNYVAECPVCGQDMIVPRENKDLAVAVSKLFNKNDLETFITYKDIMKTDTSPLYRWANESTVRKQLKNTKYIVDYTVPTLYDYIRTLSTIRRISARDGIDIDLSNVETFNDEQVALRIFHYMYIKRIAIPKLMTDTKRIKYIGLTSKSDIIEFINSIDINDYSQLINSEDITNFITRNACDFYIQDAKCNNPMCNHVIKHLLFNPKRAFFFKIGEVRMGLTARS